MVDQISDKTVSSTAQGGTIDELLSKVGVLGIVQVTVHTTIFMLLLTTASHCGMVFFTGYSPPWKCAPLATSDFCRQYNNVTFTVDMENFNYRCHLNRTDWTYIPSQKQYSVVTEFDLVCDKTSTAALISLVYYIGGLMGALMSGPIADTYGRKPTIVLSLALSATTSIALGYSHTIWHMYLLQVIRGIGSSGCLYPVFVYLSEISPPEFRSVASSFGVFIMYLSLTLMDSMAWATQNWRTFSLYFGLIAIPSLLCFLVLPESPRWLFAKERVVKAEKVLRKITQFRGNAKIHIQKESAKTTSGVYTYWHLINNWRVLKLTSSIICLWMVSPVLYYTIGAQSLNYGGNMYVNYMLASVPDIPAALLAIYLIDKLGRKKTTLACCFGSGIFTGAVALVPTSTINRRTIILSLTVLAKSCCTIGFSGIYTWTPEIFPTVLRAQALAICGTFEKMAMIAVPLICTILQNMSFSLPFVIMCALVVLASVVGLLLPETKNQPIMETYLEFVSRSTPSNNEIGLDNAGSISV